MWPLKTIKSYESSQMGQITIETGKIAPFGEGVYTFKTRAGQDNLIYNALDEFVNEALERRRVGYITIFTSFHERDVKNVSQLIRAIYL